MTKTHKEDNELLEKGKGARRKLRELNRGLSGEQQTLLDKVEASNSLFELADSMRLGRTRTRVLLSKAISSVNLAAEQAKIKEVK